MRGIPSATVLVVILLAACEGAGGSASDVRPRPIRAPSTFTIAGTLAVEEGSSADGKQGQACETGRSYRDVAAGARVTVADQDKKTIAVGRLAPGTLVKVSGERRCVFPFSVPGVPTSAIFYAVTFAHRKIRWYDRQQAAAGISLTLAAPTSG